MRLSDALTADRIKLGLNGRDKESVLRELVAFAQEKGLIADAESYAVRVLEREALHSTGLGHGIAVPHAQTEGIQGVFCCLGISRHGVDYDSIDDEPAKIICLIAAEEGLDGLYLQLLSHISRLFARGDIRRSLLDARTPDDAFAVILDGERAVTERRPVFLDD
jgi:mannitol/fructose-specific phosphotransferase system IIA component (Ntr-type)